MATRNEIYFIEQAIRSAMNAHNRQPFQILRERGAVADLRERIKVSRSLSKSIIASPLLTPRQATRYTYKNTVKVCRTQLEISVSSSSPKYKKAIDLVILKQANPELKIGENGPGDVLQQFKAKDIDVAIEVKVSQSCDPSSRGSYVQDIYALLLLRKLSLKANPIDPASCYFVLIDRNDPIYGDWVADVKPPMVWNSGVHQAIKLRKKGLQAKIMNEGLGACGLEISAIPPAHNLWIKCFFLSRRRGAINPFYASMIDGRPNAEVNPYMIMDDAWEDSQR